MFILFFYHIKGRMEVSSNSLWFLFFDLTIYVYCIYKHTSISCVLFVNYEPSLNDVRQRWRIYRAEFAYIRIPYIMYTDIDKIFPNVGGTTGEKMFGVLAT